MNADVYVNANGDLIGFNMYAYCRNNPVVHTESTGESILVPLLIGAGIGAVSKLVSDVVTSIIDNEFQLGSPSTYIGAAVGGGIGALIPGPVASGAISSMVSTTVEINLSNIYHLITGKGEYYAEEEAFYTTAQMVY